ncbi:tyrosine-type recombinase/integrase [Microbacterium kunmingense]|uniref:tyrosine-type recombinase/integrase n=1 Tax=Microbacterium kunmingense TaxID=2915939 RepID=UPI003D70DA2D
MAGSITAYTTAQGKRYRVRYRKPDKSQTDKRGFKTKREAELFLASVTVSKATGEYIDPALARITVGSLAPTWLAGKKSVTKPSTYRPLESAWKKHVQPRWSAREISGVQPSEVQAWISGLAATSSPSTVLRVHGVLAGIFDMAVADRRIPRNPARGLVLPRKRKSLHSYLSHDQLHRLAMTSTRPELVLFLGYTGLRWGEATALRIRHVNRLRRRVHVEENAVLVAGTIHVGSPKTHELRAVPYPEFLDRRIGELCAGKRPTDLLFGDGRTHLKLPDWRDGWFAGAVSRMMSEDPTFERITLHDLRHTAASLAVSSGANVKAVQRMLGHASATMTLDTYADLFDDDLEAVAVSLDAAARAASVGKTWADAVS